MNTTQSEYSVLHATIGFAKPLPGWPENNLPGLFEALGKWPLCARLSGAPMAERDPDDKHARPFQERCWGNVKAVYDHQLGRTRFYGTTPIYPEFPDAVRFFGAFVGYSFGFTVDTADPRLIADLQKAIAQNMQRPDYMASSKPL